MKNDVKREKAVLEKVIGGVWGTIGPNFCELIQRLGKPYGKKYALAAFSDTAALEAVLRGMGIGYGDEVIVSDYSLPTDASVTVAAGATPVFCDVCDSAPVLCCEKLGACVSDKTKAVIMDLTVRSAEKVKEISDFCRDKKIYFILNMGDSFGVDAAKYADAAIADMSEGTAWNVGYAGAAFTDDKDLFDSFFSFHNCGRPFGEGCSLSFGSIIGGDLRIDEWQAGLIAARLDTEKEKRFGIDEKRFVVLHRQPFFKSDYYKNYTGDTRVYTDAEFPNAVKAGL